MKTNLHSEILKETLYMAAAFLLWLAYLIAL